MWRNWARTASGEPAVAVTPAHETEVSAVVRWAAANGHRVRAVGAGHSFTDCAVTDGVQLSLDSLTGIEHVGSSFADGSRLVRVGAGMRLGALSTALAARGLALANMGDIDRQSIAGALSTGTHGTGARLGGLATQVEAVRFVDAAGDVRVADARVRSEEFELARLGLGTAGILTSVTLRVVPAFDLHALEEPRPLEEVLESLHDSGGPVARHDHFEFYWFPHSSVALTKANDRTETTGTGTQPARPLSRARYLLDDEILSNGLFAATTGVCAAVGSLTPAINRLASQALTRRRYVGPSHRVFTSPRRVRFRESEWALPAASVVPALRQIDRWLRRTGENVPFPVEVRFAAADEVWLSTAHARETAYIAVHQAMRLPFARYFRAVESIVAEHEARPHWGKLHRLDADRLRPLYPRFEDATRVRRRLDPEGLFANPYTERVLGGQ